MIDLLDPNKRSLMPSEEAVRELYTAASAESPLSEPEAVAALFARLYGVALEQEEVTAAVSRDDGELTAFAYGHPWRWEEQQDSWSLELHRKLGSASELLAATHVLSLLARHPRAARSALGSRVLEAWLTGIGGAPVWLQTTDMESPALRLYEAFGFEPIGHGPDAPNGKPGLVLYRQATPR
ncbi:GNAT family N-acetyltransferase [Agrococcus sp. Ld7]|uniref:GNAT family N-acetyltransferase n=1 Tax=Agrococcus sp. Ld7 TaxID=649148 RepID=UPI003863B67C